MTVLDQAADTAQQAPETTSASSVPEAKQQGYDAVNACLEEKQQELIQRVQGGGARPDQAEITAISVECFDKYAEAVTPAVSAGSSPTFPPWTIIATGSAAGVLLVLTVLFAILWRAAVGRARSKQAPAPVYDQSTSVNRGVGDGNTADAFCGGCGSKLRTGAPFCSRCGAPTGVPVRP